MQTGLRQKLESTCTRPFRTFRVALGRARARARARDPILMIQTFVLVSAVFCQGCSSPKDPDSFWVAVPWVVGGQSEERFIELKGLQGLRELRSDQIKVLLNPRLSGDSSLQGESPKIEVVRDSRGYWVGLDALSVTLLSIYAFFYELRLELASFGGDQLLSQAFRVGVLNSSDTATGKTSNAFYLGRSSFMFLNDGDSRTPLGINPGILGHEFFHHVFEEISLAEGNSPLIGVRSKASSPSKTKLADFFASLLPPVFSIFERNSEGEMEEPRELSVLALKPYAEQNRSADLDFNRALYLALHEGLADVWSWIYTSHANFAPLSKPEMGEERSLSGTGSELGKLSQDRILEDFFAAHSSGEHAVSYWKYRLGTEFARKIFHAIRKKQQVWPQPWEEQRRELALSILRACRKLSRARLSAIQNETMLDPFIFLRALQEEFPGLDLAIPEPIDNKTKKSLGKMTEVES